MEYRDDVYEIQTWLRRLYGTNVDGSPLIPSGIYTNQTADTVRMFQREHNLNETGVVDYETWCAVRSACMEAESADFEERIAAFPSPDYVFCEGECSDTVLICQMMLCALCVAYDCFDDVNLSGVLDEGTVQDIMMFQKINRLPETGQVDLATWNALVRNYNVFANNPSYTG